MHFVSPVYENIWKDRYCKNGESYEDNLHRVAKFCSTTKEEEDEFYQVMYDGLFFPGGRTMSNSGIGNKLTLNNCFLAGTKITTMRGLVNIEDVKIGDIVLADNDTWKPVVNTMKREYSGDIYKISANSLFDDLYCTPNHKIFTQNGWKRADRLLCGKQVAISDKLNVPHVLFPKQYEIIDIASYYNETEKDVIQYYDDNTISISHPIMNKKNKEPTYVPFGYKVNRYINITDDFLYFIGRWLGDGSITRYKGKRNHSILQIVFNAEKEKDAADFCEKVGNNVFGFKCDRRVTSQNIISLRWCNELIANFFYKEFGEKCTGKHLPKKYMGDFNILRGLIDSDGYIDSHGGGRLVLKNEHLIDWALECLYLNGINSTSKTKIKQHDDTYSVSWSPGLANRTLNLTLFKYFYDKKYDKIGQNDLYLSYIPISNIEILENQQCTVYNLSVQDIHSYCANGVRVSNCFVAPSLRDDLSDIFDKVKLGAMTHQRGGGIGYCVSNLRPAGTPTSNDAIASGPVSFMHVFNAQTATILQGGRRK